MESARVIEKPRHVDGLLNILEVTVERTVLESGDFSQKRTSAVVRLDGRFDPVREEYPQLPNLGQGRHLTPVVEVEVFNGGTNKRYNPREDALTGDGVVDAVVEYFNSAFIRQFVE